MTKQPPIHKESLFMPVQNKTGAVGYVIGASRRQVQDSFVDSMGTGATWERLHDKGWRIIPVEVFFKGRHMLERTRKVKLTGAELEMASNAIDLDGIEVHKDDWEHARNIVLCGAHGRAFKLSGSRGPGGEWKRLTPIED